MVDEAMSIAYWDAKRRGLIGGVAKTTTVMYTRHLMEQLKIKKDKADESVRIEQILREESILKDEFRVIYSTEDIRDLGITEQYGPARDTAEEAEAALVEKLIELGKDPETTDFIRVECRTKVVIESTDWS